jgi:protein-tyrosine phosphatase
MCEALLKRAAARSTYKIEVLSAGLNAEAGRSAHPWAILAALEHNISLQDHRAQKLTAQLMDEADVIFAMDFNNRSEILSRFPAAKKKILMLGAFMGPSGLGPEIYDPYSMGPEATKHCYRILNTCVGNLALQISTPRPSSKSPATPNK